MSQQEPYGSCFFIFFVVHWVFPHSVKEALEGWKGQAVGKKKKEAWIAGPLCLFMDCMVEFIDWLNSW